MHKNFLFRFVSSRFFHLIQPCIVAATFLVFVSASANAQINVWAQTGEDKVSRDELRVAQNRPGILNSVWDGSTLRIFGARNEVVNAAVIIEAPSADVTGLSVALPSLTGPGGTVIGSRPVTGNDIFNWTGRNIELFYLRYLQITGLTLNGFEHYDERHIPLRFERPWSGQGVGKGTWTDRPDHDKFYPDIAVPLELVPAFTISAGQNQSIWIDVYIPETAPAGVYSGSVSINQQQTAIRSIPVELTVRNFTLPDVPTSKTMVVYTPPNLNLRYDGVSYVNPRDVPAGARSILIRDRHFQLAHRHRLALVDSNYDWVTDEPSPLEWPARLDGSLFTAASGYDGPGVGQGNGVFSIGLYGTWTWMNGTQTDMQTHTNAWESWFEANSPNTERSLYLTDESTDYPQVEGWASWVKTNPGPGSRLKTYATIDLPSAAAQIPSLSIDGATLFVADPNVWQPAADDFINNPPRELYLYNGHRPASGSFAIEDEGSSLRELPWGQYKKNISRWYMWESTYYNDYIKGTGNTNVFESSDTFGGQVIFDPVLGNTGANSSGYSNGDGVLFYPGTDQLFPQDSYGVDGPFASIRMKFWRRGIQDVDYLALASAIDPVHTAAIVNRMVPKVLWENGVADPSDPTYQLCPISWSINPDDWEAARSELAGIIESNGVEATATPTSLPSATNVPTIVPATPTVIATSTAAATKTSNPIATSTHTPVPTSTVPASQPVSPTKIVATPTQVGTPTPAATIAAATPVPTVNAEEILKGTISGQLILRGKSPRTNLTRYVTKIHQLGSIVASNVIRSKYSGSFDRTLRFVIKVPAKGRYTVKAIVPTMVAKVATYRLVIKSKPAAVKISALR